MARDNALLPPNFDLERRRQIWQLLASPLFDFAWDEETPADDLRRIGHEIVELGYADAEIRWIYWSEVFPAIAGAWLAIDPRNPDWLQQRIIFRPRIGLYLTCILRPWWIWVGWDCWRKITHEVANERRLLMNCKKTDLNEAISDGQ